MSSWYSTWAFVRSTIPFLSFSSKSRERKKKTTEQLYSYTSFYFRPLKNCTVICNNGIRNDLWPSSAGYVKRSWTKNLKGQDTYVCTVRLPWPLLPSRHFLLRRPLFPNRNRTVRKHEVIIDEDWINVASQRPRKNDRRKACIECNKKNSMCVESITFCIDLQEVSDHTRECKKNEARMRCERDMNAARIVHVMHM